MGRTGVYNNSTTVSLSDTFDGNNSQMTTLPAVPAPAATHTLGEQVGGNNNHFAYLTSGFHSVNESFLQQQCEAVMRTVTTATGVGCTFLEAAVRAGEIDRDY